MSEGRIGREAHLARRRKLAALAEAMGLWTADPQKREGARRRPGDGSKERPVLTGGRR